MANGDRFEMEGEVVDCIKGGKFIVHLDKLDRDVECTSSGRLKQNFIKIIRGDKVTVDISPYDLTKGRILWRG
jgi:translation initiation factor IF-1